MNCVRPIDGLRDVNWLAEDAVKISTKYPLLVRLGVLTGLRVSDILALKVGDVREGVENGFMSVRERKTGKYRVVALDANIALEFDWHVRVNALQDEHYLIFSNPYRKNKPLSRQQAWRIIRRFGGDGIAPHSLRKTYAKDYFTRTGDIEGLREALNHKYIDTTLGYLVNKDEARRMMALLATGEYEIVRGRKGIGCKKGPFSHQEMACVKPNNFTRSTSSLEEAV
jgi:integrase